MRILITLAALIPAIAFAGTFADFARSVVYGIANPLIILIVGLTVLYFFWGSAKYILNAADATARAEGRKMMLYGVIGIFVMVSLWGFVNLLAGTFRLDNAYLPSAESILGS